LRNKRYTLSVKHVRKGDELVEVVDYLIAQVIGPGLRVGRLYLDRGFYIIDAINHLKEKGVPFIIPCIVRGKTGGIRRLLKGGRSYSTSYTMRSAGKKATVQVNIVVRYRRGKWKRHGIEYLAFAVHSINMPVARTHREYRKRFGVESNYKLMNTARAKTSSRSPVLRLLYVALGFLLMNLWIYHHWIYVSVKRRGGRELMEWRFKTMLRQPVRAIEDALGFAVDVVIPA
jgi:putative transposase